MDEDQHRKLLDLDDTNPGWRTAFAVTEGMSTRSVLHLTLKTHKKKTGNAVPRNIHNASGSAFQGLSAYIDHMLQPIVGKFAHVVRDSEDFVQQVRGLVLPAGGNMVRTEVRHFFYSGSPDQLVQKLRAALQLPLQPWATTCRSTAGT